MAENDKFYRVSDYGNQINFGDKMKLEMSIYPSREVAEISSLTTLPIERLQSMREESAAAEQAIFDNLRESAKEWENQAAQTLLLDLSIEYARTPPVQHTSNQWEKTDYNHNRISNMVYQMSYHVYEQTQYDRESQKSIPVAWYLTWSVHTNSPTGRNNTKIAGQDRKRYINKADMEKYLAGRIKTYLHLFTEISPPLPQEYAKRFRVNGQLLPGCFVKGEEPPAATLGGAFISSENQPQKESENMNEPLNIRLANREAHENGSTDGAWLKLPATSEQLQTTLTRIGAQDGALGKDYFINNFESSIPVIAGIPLENIQEVGINRLNYLAAQLESFDAVNEIPQEYQIAPDKPYKPNIDYDTIDTPATAVNVADPQAQQQTAAIAAAPLVLEADNPRDRMKEITAKLENGVKEVFESEKYKNYLNTLSKFHNYSVNNSLLIAMQMPKATQVAGFNAWQRDFKRVVKKGEKGMKIIAPAPFKAKREVDKLDAKGKPVIGADGRPVKEEKEITVPAFTVATVFDVSQTEGEPLPQLGVNELAGSVDKYKEFYPAIEKISPVSVNFEKIPTGAKGYFQIEEKRIAINEGMSELQNLKTLIHEIAHARIHDIDKNAPKDTPRADQRTREVQAESIAYTVCQHYGLDTSDYSFAYVASWSGGKELDTLKSSLDVIRKEADAIITEVDKNFAELTKNQEQTAEIPPQKEASIKSKEPALAQGENVAAIETKAMAGEVINISDLSEAIKKDKQAAQPSQVGTPGKPTGKTGQTHTTTQSKTAPNAQEKPSIREQLAAGKKQLTKQKSAPQQSKTKNRAAGLGG